MKIKTKVNVCDWCFSKLAAYKKPPEKTDDEVWCDDEGYAKCDICKQEMPAELITVCKVPKQ